MVIFVVALGNDGPREGYTLSLTPREQKCQGRVQRFGEKLKGGLWHHPAQITNAISVFRTWSEMPGKPREIESELSALPRLPTLHDGPWPLPLFQF